MNDPRFCYLVFSHREPDQVARLVRAIRTLSPTARVIVTHDVRHSLPPDLADDGAVEVHIRPGGAPWGSIAMVDAILDRLRELEAIGDYDYVGVISGQDFPLRPLQPWEVELRDSEIDALLQPHPMPGRLKWGSRRNGLALHLTRYTHRHLRPPVLRPGTDRIRRRYRWLLQRAAANLSPIVTYLPLPGGGSILGVRRLRTPFGDQLPCRKGSSWFALSRRAVQHVLTTDDRLELRQYYSHTLCPDESYFHTAVRMNPELKVRLGPITADIFRTPFDPHPETITPEALGDLLERAEANGAAFGRKFDTAIPGTIEALEHRLGLAALP